MPDFMDLNYSNSYNLNCFMNFLEFKRFILNLGKLTEDQHIFSFRKRFLFLIQSFPLGVDPFY